MIGAVLLPIHHLNRYSMTEMIAAVAVVLFVQLDPLVLEELHSYGFYLHLLK
jgi:hypothetical protein